jgi:hypothetical protein
MKMTLDPELASEAKALVALAFRNGPVEDLHAGKPCPACSGKAEISHISDEEMKHLMKSAVNALYRLLWRREHDPRSYQEQLAFGRRYTAHWDDPEINTGARRGTRPR